MSMEYLGIPSDVKVIAIIDSGHGDGGKGKFVDWLGRWAEYIARGTGGANAGHTIKLGLVEYIFHLVPSGILHPVTNIIGNGVALDPRILLDELAVLKKEGIQCTNLCISLKAKLVLPHHLLLDRAIESAKSTKIGTTGRGIGPVYADHTNRIGLIVNDLLNPDIFAKKLAIALDQATRFLSTFPPDLIKEIMEHEHLGGGRFYSADGIFNQPAIVDEYTNYGRQLESMITDTDGLLRHALSIGRKILLEGAQGNQLSVDFGAHPNVTSSDATVHGLAKGVGLSTTDVDLVLAITKAPYMTRVGNGPFPTELGGKESESWCATSGVTRTKEEMQYPKVSLKSQDEFELGIAIRKAGNEYGATTGRPRRTGWLDLATLRPSLAISGAKTKLVLTKVDVLDHCPTIRLCVSYIYNGPDYKLGGMILRTGDTIHDAIMVDEVLRHCSPVYREFPGWMCETRHLHHPDNLPKNLLDIMNFIEETTGVEIAIVSVGPDREETIIC